MGEENRVPPPSESVFSGWVDGFIHRRSLDCVSLDFHCLTSNSQSAACAFVINLKSSGSSNIIITHQFFNSVLLQYSTSNTYYAILHTRAIAVAILLHHLEATFPFMNPPSFSRRQIQSIQTVEIYSVSSHDISQLTRTPSLSWSPSFPLPYSRDPQAPSIQSILPV